MIRAKHKINLHLVRHAEAYKNLARVHGGGDQRLTEMGIHQADNIGRYLLSQIDSSDKLGIVYQPEGRTEATAKRIGLVTMSSIVCEPQIKGVGMGIVAGMSEEELAKKYPEVSAGLMSWRNSEGTLKRPEVPGSEPMIDFAERIGQGLYTNVDNIPEDGFLAIIGTTSSLVMLKHLLTHDGFFDRPGYEFSESPLGSVNS